MTASRGSVPKKKRTLIPLKGVKKVRETVKVKTSGVQSNLIRGKRVGFVTHYFPKVNAAVVKMEKGKLRLGDLALFKGPQTRLEQSITSMQINRQPIQTAQPGQEIGLQVSKPVEEGDIVYLVSRG